MIKDVVRECIQERKDKWIQSAVNPAHKGDCTPMTKATCTPARKALAKRFKSGDIHQDNVDEMSVPKDYDSDNQEMRQMENSKPEDKLQKSPEKIASKPESKAETKSVKSIKTSIENCARCGKEHKNLTFKPFTNKSMKYGYWAACPSNGEPILMKMMDDKKETK